MAFNSSSVENNNEDKQVLDLCDIPFIEDELSERRHVNSKVATSLESRHNCETSKNIEANLTHVKAGAHDLESDIVTIKPTMSISELKPSVTQSPSSAPSVSVENTEMKGYVQSAGHSEHSPLCDTTASRNRSQTDSTENNQELVTSATKRKGKSKGPMKSIRRLLTCTGTGDESKHEANVYESTRSSQQLPVKIDNILGIIKQLPSRLDITTLFWCWGSKTYENRNVKNCNTDAFLHYNHDTQEPGRPHGRGLCVIFTLFTGDLKGYLVDKLAAFNFFKNRLDYDVFCDAPFVNCSQSQFKSKMRQIQLVISSEAKKHGKPYYDRFVFIMLTHGETDGLMTCSPEDPSGVLEEKRQVCQDGHWTGKRVLTTVEDIISYFKHDSVPELKNKPKMFLIQSCRGSKELKAAGGEATDSLTRPQYDLTKLPLRPEVAIDADILVLFATTIDHESWVSPTDGSWFIQKSLQVFQRHYKSKHVEEMTTLINLVISEERGKTVGHGGKITSVLQMPCKFSTLRMKFYL